MLEYKSLQRANFWKVFSTLIDNGVSIQQAFSIAVKWADKELFKLESKIITKFEKNKDLLSIMESYHAFTDLEKELIKCGNDTGKIGLKSAVISDLLNSVGLPINIDNSAVIEDQAGEIFEEIEENVIDSDFSNFFEGEELKEAGFEEFHENLNDENNDDPISKFVNYIIFRAISDRVTGITVEAFETHLKIIYFKDDKIITPDVYNNLPLKLYDEVIYSLKDWADDMDPLVTDIKQTGFIEIKDDNFKVVVQVKSQPTNFGEIINIAINYN